MRRRLLILALPLLAFAACSSPSPAQQLWPQYSKAVRDILADYEIAMNEIAQVQLSLNPPQQQVGGPPPPTPIKPDDAVARLEKDIIPKLEAAANKAGRLNLGSAPRLAQMHKPLADGLAAKAEAYRTIVKAFKARKTGDFDQGMSQLGQAGEMIQTFRKDFDQVDLAGGPTE